MVRVSSCTEVKPRGENEKLFHTNSLLAAMSLCYDMKENRKKIKFIEINGEEKFSVFEVVLKSSEEVK